jgi:UDP-glucose:(heptosyl)LPS alpha-1,3-glucosyltransferase
VLHSSHASCSRRKFDVIHSYCRTSYQDILRLGGGTHREYLIRTDPVYSVFGRMWRKMRPKERLELALEQESFAPKASKKIVAVSHRVKEEVIRHYGVPAEKIAVIHNGVDANEFKPSADAPADPEPDRFDETDYAFSRRNGFRRKGLESAIAAVDRVPSAKLVVVAKAAAGHPRVLMLGRRTDVSHLYAAADAFIFPPSTTRSPTRS